MAVENEDPLLKTKEAAAYLGGLSFRTLEGWRLRGGGPAFFNVGRSVYYRRSALDRWLDEREERRSTSDPGRRQSTAAPEARASASE